MPTPSDTRPHSHPLPPPTVNQAHQAPHPHPPSSLGSLGRARPHPTRCPRPASRRPVVCPLEKVAPPHGVRPVRSGAHVEGAALGRGRRRGGRGASLSMTTQKHTLGTSMSLRPSVLPRRGQGAQWAAWGRNDIDWADAWCVVCGVRWQAVPAGQAEDARVCEKGANTATHPIHHSHPPTPHTPRPHTPQPNTPTHPPAWTPPSSPA